MVATYLGIMTWSMTRNEDAHREYKIKHRITAEKDDGPFTVLNTPGLPAVGSPWVFGNDADMFAWCWPTTTVNPVIDQGANFYWDVEQTFSTFPHNFCKEDENQDPLLQKPKLSGSFIKFTEEARFDRFGRPVVSSSFEPLRGQQVEFDDNRPTVRIEMNVPTLDLNRLYSAVDKVNDSDLWGFRPRMIKLMTAPWERLFYGQCFEYYKVTYEFEINTDTFDRLVMDEGEKVLMGDWDEREEFSGHYVLKRIDGNWPDPFNPAHFIRLIDKRGNLTRIPLNGRGLPAGAKIIGDDPNTVGTGTEIYESDLGQILIEKYDEFDFLSLGVPAIIP